MFGDRTPPEEARAQPASNRRGQSLALIALVVALVLLVLGTRRGNESTLEPPF